MSCERMFWKLPLSRGVLPCLRHALTDFLSDGHEFRDLALYGTTSTRESTIKWMLQRTVGEGAIDDDTETDEHADFLMLQNAIRMVRNGARTDDVMKYIKPMLEEEEEYTYGGWQKPAPEDPEYNPDDEDSEASTDSEEEEEASTDSEEEDSEASTDSEEEDSELPPAKRRC